MLSVELFDFVMPMSIIQLRITAQCMSDLIHYTVVVLFLLKLFVKFINVSVFINLEQKQKGLKIFYS